MHVITTGVERRRWFAHSYDLVDVFSNLGPLWIHQILL